MTEFRLPKYEAICERCGHVPGVHTPRGCANVYRMLTGEREAVCDCAGWKRDEGWPPPLIVREGVR